jgi:hypothetical protein
MTEHIQAKEFVEFVRDHVVVADRNNLDSSSEKETAWFDWQAFRAAVAAFRGKRHLVCLLRNFGQCMAVSCKHRR